MFGSRIASQADVKAIVYKTTRVRILFDIIKKRLGDSDNNFNKSYLDFGILEASIKHTEINEREVKQILYELEKAALVAAGLLTDAEKEYATPMSVRISP